MFLFFIQKSISEYSSESQGFTEEVCSLYDGDKSECLQYGCRFSKKDMKCHSSLKSVIPHVYEPFQYKYKSLKTKTKHETEQSSTPQIRTKHETEKTFKHKHIDKCSFFSSEYSCTKSRHQCVWDQKKCVSASTIPPVTKPTETPQVQSLIDKIAGVENDNSFFSKKKKQNICFATYSPRGCPTCHSRNPNITCGWCQSQGFCAEGSIKGPSLVQCPSQDWIFNQTQCNSDMCAVARTRNSCRSPCHWSLIRGKCTAPISLMEVANSIIESVENAFSHSKWFIVAAGIILGVVVLVAFVGFLITVYHRHLYH